MITVRRPSGLAVPFDPPELTMAASIDRSCEQVSDAGLIGPKQPEYLPTYPHSWALTVPATVPGGPEGPWGMVHWQDVRFADYYDHLL